MSRLSLSCAVLAGGQSRRMGTDKALLEFAGRPLLSRTIETVRQVGDEVFVVGDRPAYHRFGVPVVPDAVPGSGTLGGIATALQAAMHPYVLVVACDMPLLSLPLLQAMAEVERDYDALVPVTPGARAQQGRSNTYETLHSIYSRASLPVIQRQLEAGNFKVISFFDNARVHELEVDWIRQYDPELRSFLNTNDPDEFARAAQLLEVQSD